MESSNLQRHQIIKSFMTQHTEKVEDAIINLWEPLAYQIISIVGEEGFNSLYARTIFLNQAIFPWLVADPLPANTNHRFANLKKSFEEQKPAQVSESNSLLLITFTDILSSLIGEPLTTHILQLAWGNDILMRTGKEFDNE